MGNSFYGNVSISGGGGVTPAEVDSKITANNIIQEGIMDNKIAANNTVQQGTMDTKDTALKNQIDNDIQNLIAVSKTNPTNLTKGGIWFIVQE